MNKNIFIGGAWPYGNYLMHIGHLVALLPADVIARFHRLNGDSVIYVSGTDCHGTPITQRAKKEGKHPSEIASYYHNEFVKTFKALNFQYNLYTATMTDYHKNRVKELFKSIYDNGYIYEKEVEQDYCPTCNTFLSDREIEGECPHCGKEASGDQCDSCFMELDPTELKNKHCKTCKTPVVQKNNKHLYFKMSAFENEIRQLVEKNKDKWRVNAVNETLKYLEQGLKDRAVTRQLDWGVEIPVDGYSDKRLYVWIEAVMGYLTAGEQVATSNNVNFDDYVKNENAKLYFVHGKDNIVFHTIIFPSLLLAMKDNYSLPTDIISCEFMNMNDEKMSKSKGNIITVNELLEKYNSDSIRYYFCINNPERKDASFSDDDFIAIHNKHLCGGLGNFVNRNLSFLVKKFNGNLPNTAVDEEVRNYVLNAYKEIGDLFDRGEIKTATIKIYEYISYCNKYYDSSEPWVSAKKEDLTEFNNITSTCLYLIANMANIINPVMPVTADKLRELLDLDSACWQEITYHKTHIDSAPILFNKIEENK